MQNKIYMRPKKAEKKMRLAQDINQTVWLYGVTGSGKTSFIKDYFGKKRYEYFSADEFLSGKAQIPKDKEQHIVVIDDFHTVTQADAREEMYPLLEDLMRRREVWLILIARCAVPRWVMPLYVEYMFYIIDEQDLMISQEQQESYFEMWGIHLTERTFQDIWNLGKGNPLLYHLAAMELISAEMKDVNDSDKRKMEQEAIKQAVKQAYSYVETHVYDQWDPELQEFLMEMSIVKKFDLQMAQMITGKQDAGRLIDMARETGNFLAEKDGVYEYRLLFAESMRRRMERTCGAEWINRLYYNAGRYYELKGDIPNALAAYEKCHDKSEVSRLLIANARRNPANGHYYQLRRYYLSLPEETVRQSAVLMAGMSMLQSILMNEEESERWYHMLEEFAESQTGGAKKEAKSRLLYLDIALPHRGSLHMTDILKHAAGIVRERKVILPELSVTSNLPSQLNGGKDFCEWSRKDKELAASIGKMVSGILGRYGKAVVSLALAESFLEKGQDNYEIITLAERGRMQAESAGVQEQCFVAVQLLAQLSLLNGHVEDSVELINSFEKKVRADAPTLLPNIRTLKCSYNLYRGRTKEIMEWMEEAPDENEAFCTMERMRYLIKVRVYLLSGKYEKAFDLLQKLQYYAEKMKRTYIGMEVKLLLAVTLDRLGQKEWEEMLQECITEAESYHFVRLFSREGAASLKLLKAGNFKWEDRAYKKQVMEECEKMAAYYPSYLRFRGEGEVKLSSNALKVLRLQAEGYSTEKIAKILGITISTVKYHSQETYKKLGVTSKAAAVNEARNRKLL